MQPSILKIMFYFSKNAVIDYFKLKKLKSACENGGFIRVYGHSLSTYRMGIYSMISIYTCTPQWIKLCFVD